jgi:hypothetical protein
MTDLELLSLVLFAWAGVATGLYLDAKREIKMTKIIILHLVENKDERDRFFNGFETVIASRRKRHD